LFLERSSKNKGKEASPAPQQEHSRKTKTKGPLQQPLVFPVGKTSRANPLGMALLVFPKGKPKAKGPLVFPAQAAGKLAEPYPFPLGKTKGKGLALLLLQREVKRDK
jgi:hypothetical protein